MRRHPMLVVDVVIRTPRGVVLIKRKNEPYGWRWALPGGFVRYGERVEDAAAREAKEETGLRVKLGKLVGVYSDPKRDPRGHVISVCFSAGRASGRLRASSDAQDVKIFKHIPWRELAFDHARILKEAGLR